MQNHAINTEGRERQTHYAEHTVQPRQQDVLSNDPIERLPQRRDANRTQSFSIDISCYPSALYVAMNRPEKPQAALELLILKTLEKAVLRQNLVRLASR